MADDQHPDILWRGDVPVATAFDDPYFSLDDGLAETRYVFLEGNGLPDRFRPEFRIAELGFGTGLNALVAARAWERSGQGGRLSFTSFERFPLNAADMGRALAAFPDLADLSRPLIEGRERGATEITLPLMDLTLIVGDARKTLPLWDGAADAWFLDGFAPARNPELWEPCLLAEVARHTAPGGTAATYTAAGAVRRALAEAGFVVERRDGYGRKRHMTSARLP